MLSTKNKVSIISVFAILAMLFSFANVSPALAAPQGEVRGNAKVQFYDPATHTITNLSVNAWLDENGVAHGMMIVVGGLPYGFTIPPADPWQMDVTSIDLSGNTAIVCWVVVHSVFPEDIGITDCLDFTDNRATGAPDEIGGVPIEAGNIIVR